MKHFFVIIAITILLDFAAGKVLSGWHQNLDGGEFGTINKLINDPQQEIYIFGSSRAKYHYKSLVIEGVTGQKCYNAGFNGRGILLSTLLIKLLLKEHQPKTIILDINFLSSTFDKEYKRLDILRPYYFKYTEVQELLNEESPLERLKYFSRSYPYNATIPALIEQEIDKEGPDENKGFLELKGSILKSTDVYKQAENKLLDPKLLSSFYTVCDLAKEKGVKLLICISPSLERFSDESIREIKEGLDARKIEFIDFSSIDRFKSKELFFDAQHLNSFGAELFSMKIAELIKQDK